MSVAYAAPDFAALSRVHTMTVCVWCKTKIVCSFRCIGLKRSLHGTRLCLNYTKVINMKPFLLCSIRGVDGCSFPSEDIVQQKHVSFVQASSDKCGRVLIWTADFLIAKLSRLKPSLSFSEACTCVNRKFYGRVNFSLTFPLR